MGRCRPRPTICAIHSDHQGVGSILRHSKLGGLAMRNIVPMRLTLSTADEAYKVWQPRIAMSTSKLEVGLGLGTH